MANGERKVSGLDLREQIARIDRSIDEAAKARAESRKYDPWILVLGASIAAVAARLPEILHALGAGP